MAVRIRDLLFYGGGECLIKFGTLSLRTSPAEDVPETHVRGTDGSFIDANGDIHIASSDIPRIEWIDQDADGVLERPTILLEALDINQAIRSDDYNTGWSKGGVAVASDDAASPNGLAASADKVTASTGNATLVLNMGIIASAEQIFTVYLKRLTGTGNIDLTLDGSTWTTRVITSSWARYQLIQTLADPDCGIRIVTSGDVVHMWGADVKKASYPSSYIATVAAAVTRNADVLYFDFPPRPQALTILVTVLKWMAGPVSATVLHIGSATAGADPRLVISVASDGKILATYDDGTTEAATGQQPAPTDGQKVEMLLTLTKAGVVDFGVAIDDGAESALDSAAGGALPATWAGQRIYFNSAGTTLVGYNRFDSVKVARGVRTLAEMRTLFA